MIFISTYVSENAGELSPGEPGGENRFPQSASKAPTRNTLQCLTHRYSSCHSAWHMYYRHCCSLLKCSTPPGPPLQYLTQIYNSRMLECITTLPEWHSGVYHHSGSNVPIVQCISVAWVYHPSVVKVVHRVSSSHVVCGQAVSHSINVVHVLIGPFLLIVLPNEMLGNEACLWWSDLP